MGGTGPLAGRTIGHTGSLKEYLTQQGKTDTRSASLHTNDGTGN